MFGKDLLQMSRTPLILLVLLFSFSAIAQEETPCTVTVDNVIEFRGEIVEFCGTPTTVSASELGKVKGDPVYLNFGGEYPDHTFSVIIWGDVAGKDREKMVKRYSGKELKVKGWVKVYNDKPVITVMDLKDIAVK